jgi:hypothetical protein
VRTLERDIELPDGTRGVAKLEVGFTQFGTITTEDQKMFYALIRHWEENGKPADRPVYFSDRLISRLLKKKGWGTNVIVALTSSLRRLRTTPLRWIKSYHRKDNPARQYEEESFFSFLDTLKIVTRKEHGHVTNQQGYFQFDKEILSNLLNHYTKPLLDEEFFKLQTEIGQLLYTHVDLMLAAKDAKGRVRTFYERKTRDLFFDLGLLQDNPSYRYPSNRKQALMRPIAELQGCRLSTGLLKSITIERTQDGKDYKIIFQKGRVQEPAELPESESVTPPTSPAGETVVVNHYGKAADPAIAAAEELVSYFYQVFHSVATHYPRTPETAKAMSLIGQHGMQRARYVVDFAKRAAAESNYLPQTFGGILQYTSRALSELDREKPKAPRPGTTAVQARAAVRDQKRDGLRARGERRLASLTPDQYTARFESAKAELCRVYPAMARLLAQKASTAAENTIRGWMTRYLSDQTMDILALDGATDPEAVRRKLGLQNLPL